MDYKEKSVKGNSLSNFFLTFANIIFPFISTPYISRVLRIEDIGLLNKGAALSTLFINICSAGLAGYGARQIARVRKDKSERDKVFSSVLICHILTVFAGIVFYLIYVLIFTQDSIQLVYLIYAFLLVINPITIEWFYQGMEDFGYIALRSVLVKVISILLLFILVREERDFYIYGGLLVGAQGLNSFYNIFHVRKYVHFSLKGINIFKTLCASRYFYLQTLVAILYQNLNQILLGKDQVELALYVRATTITALIGITATAVENAVKPRLENIYTSNKKEIYYEYINKAASLVFVLVIPAAFGMSILSKDVMHLFGGEQFSFGSVVLSILSIQGFVTCISVFLNMIISTPVGKENNTFIANLMVSIVAGILNPFLIPKYGAKGASIVILLAECIGCMTHFLLIKKQKLYLGWINKNFIKYILSAMLMVVSVLFVIRIFNNIYIKLLIGIVLGIVSYLIGIIFFSFLLKDKEEFLILKRNLFKLGK